MSEPTIGRGLLSRAIQWQSDGPYSHVAIWMPDGKVIESAAPNGVRVHPSPWTAHDKRTQIDRFRVTRPVNWDRSIAFMHEHIGDPYDFAAIARFITRLRGASETRWICSEFAFMAIQKGGVNLLERIEAHRVSPNRFAHSPLLEQIETYK
jgi:uncharacterized protein YycO